MGESEIAQQLAELTDAIKGLKDPNLAAGLGQLAERVQKLEAKYIALETSQKEYEGKIEAITEVVMKHETPDTAPQQSETRNNINWKNGEGNRGPYQWISTDEDRVLAANLRDHQGRMTLGDYYYWLGKYGDRIFRRQNKSRR